MRKKLCNVDFKTLTDICTKFGRRFHNVVQTEYSGEPVITFTVLSDMRRATYYSATTNAAPDLVAGMLRQLADEVEQRGVAIIGSDDLSAFQKAKENDDAAGPR